MTDPQPRILARFTDYVGLVQALRDRFHEIGIPHRVVDKIAGIADGLTQKMIQKRMVGAVPVKQLGYDTLGPVLTVGAVELWLVENTGQLAALKQRHDWQPDQWTPNKRAAATSRETMLAKRKPKIGAPGGKRNPRFGNTEWGRQMRARQIVLAEPGYLKRIATKAGHASARKRKLRRKIVEALDP